VGGKIGVVERWGDSEQQGCRRRREAVVEKLGIFENLGCRTGLGEWIVGIV